MKPFFILICLVPHVACYSLFQRVGEKKRKNSAPGHHQDTNTDNKINAFPQSFLDFPLTHRMPFRNIIPLEIGRSNFLSRQDFLIILQVACQKLRRIQTVRTFAHAAVAVEAVLDLHHLGLALRRKMGC